MFFLGREGITVKIAIPRGPEVILPETNCLRCPISPPKRPCVCVVWYTEIGTEDFLFGGFFPLIGASSLSIE
jgi:hypothetical protein